MRLKAHFPNEANPIFGHSAAGPALSLHPGRKWRPSHRELIFDGSNGANPASKDLGMLITRRVEFSASHICAVPGFTEEQNRALYGAAANPNGHGHNYVVEVTLEGEPDRVTGMVYDLKDLKEVLNREVVDPMDHRNLNREVPPFDKVVPTVENLALEIWRRLCPTLTTDSIRLHTVRVYETPDLFVECHGE